MVCMCVCMWGGRGGKRASASALMNTQAPVGTYWDGRDTLHGLAQFARCSMCLCVCVCVCARARARIRFE
jgi:hypothetical protein